MTSKRSPKVKKISPKSSSPKKKHAIFTRKFTILGLFIGAILLGLIVSLGANSSSLLQNPKSFIDTLFPVSTKGWKTYTNDFYHFTLNIPSTWKAVTYINEFGENIFKISSPDNTIIIQNERTYRNDYRVKSREIAMPKVMIGKFLVDRYRSTTDLNEIIDTASVGEKQQKNVDFYFVINGNFESNNKILLEVLKSFTYTQKEPLLEDLFSYELPEGWVRDEESAQNPSMDSIRFHSGDMSYPYGPPYFTTGAIISIRRSFKNPKTSLKDDIDATVENFENKPYDYPRLQIDGIEGLNAFMCYEGCSDSYFLVKDDYLWRINFSCAPNCVTKSGSDNSKYSIERDSFLKSIHFRDME